MSKPNYDEQFKKKIKENFEVFDINDSNVRTKIQNFSKKYVLDFKTVLEEVEKSDIVKAFFIKDPTKQNIHEDTFGDFLKNIKGVKNYIQLPKGKNSENTVFIINQEVRMGSKTQKSITSMSKSIDFKFNYKNLNTDFYVCHKYTNEPGGAQDNQKNDVINTIKNASSPYINYDIFILFVCDGNYWSKKEKNFIEVSSHINNENFKLINSEDLEDFLNKFIDFEK
ncbi:hypothetical protein SHELI_v1c00380 [Spiroplasma helicoides]|uniref:Restriction endonuclease type II DpnII-like domain-containing protein n=1 Tax=Spiroplasma helicoides TaxID=216938 RepID=A0A1B3SJ87_9MOLU|nr:hypothetical protein [Spiroplasma helicoides]AOG59993.1 hypothetical protein SHELI_v1c00380 [Spiroplasma helicoides]